MSSVNKDSHRRRHSRRPSSQSGKSQLSPPSTMSLLSTSTSGSNSTVVPERFLRSSLRPPKGQESKRPATRTSLPSRDNGTESVGNHSDKENVTAVLSSNRWELKKTTTKEPVSKGSVTKEASLVKRARREPAQEGPAQTKSDPMKPIPVEKVRVGNRAKKLANDHFDVFSFMMKDGQEVNSDAEKAEKEEEEEEEDGEEEEEEEEDEDEDAEEEEEEEDDEEEEVEEDKEEKEERKKGVQGKEEVIENEVEKDEREDEKEEEEEDEEIVEDGDGSDEDDQQGHAENNVDKAPSTFSASPHVSHPAISSSCDLEVVAPPEIPQQHHIWRKSEASLHSDSGISVRSSSPERESPAPRHRHPYVRKLSSYGGTMPNPNYPGYYPPAPMPPVAYVPRTPAYPRDWSTYGNPVENPEVYYASTRPVVTQTMQRPARLPPPNHHHQSCNHQLIRGSPHPQPEMSPQKKSGYDELAAALDSRGDAVLRPIYRKFETLNHRILLYLQDEISEMEEELRELDLAITHEEAMLGNTHASRRAEAKLPSQLQWHRLELLSRSYTKVEQYSRALSSYSNLTQSLEPASKADINTYKSWISENAPIVEHETTFLRKERDLVAISPKPLLSSLPSRKASYSQLMGSSDGPRSREEIETPVFIVAFTLVSTIIVFKVVPMILARLVISAVFGVATLGTIAPGVLGHWGRGLREWKRGIAIYTGVMLVLAFVVS